MTKKGDLLPKEKIRLEWRLFFLRGCHALLFSGNSRGSQKSCSWLVFFFAIWPNLPLQSKEYILDCFNSLPTHPLGYCNKILKIRKYQVAPQVWQNTSTVKTCWIIILTCNRSLSLSPRLSAGPQEQSQCHASSRRGSWRWKKSSSRSFSLSFFLLSSSGSPSRLFKLGQTSTFSTSVLLFVSPSQVAGSKRHSGNNSEKISINFLLPFLLSLQIWSPLQRH